MFVRFFEGLRDLWPWWLVLCFIFAVLSMFFGTWWESKTLKSERKKWWLESKILWSVRKDRSVRSFARTCAVLAICAGLPFLVSGVLWSIKAIS